MAEDQVVKELCDERHKHLNEWRISVDARIKVVENRFLLIMTTLALTFLGVIVNLVLVILKVMK